MEIDDISDMEKKKCPFLPQEDKRKIHRKSRKEKQYKFCFKKSHDINTKPLK